MDQIYLQTQAAMEELMEKAKVKPGSIVVVGCSTSEVLGAKIGTNSSPDTAGQIFAGLYDCAKAHGVYLAIQCCEHLNRAIITERAAVPGAETVNVVPQPKAGGSLATAAYAAFADPVAVEHHRIGDAPVVAARTRPKFIGGIRAIYDEALL